MAEEATRRPRVLWVSDSPVFDCVGQSRVTREFCSRLTKFYDVVVAGFMHLDELAKQKRFPYPVVNIDRRELVKQLPKVVEQVKPDVVLYSHDAFLVGEAAIELRNAVPGVRQIGYFTIDGEPVYHRWRDLFERMEAIVVPSLYGQRAIEDAWVDMPTTVIPYGVDRTVYRPPTAISKNDLKKHVDEFFKANLTIKTKLAKLQNNFSVIVVGMNQSRKNLGAVHYAWREFAAKHDDVSLVLITHSQSPTQMIGTYDLNCFADMKNSLILYTTVPEDAYVRILAACDCLLHPSLGEGFGLPVLEALSAGVTPIVTDFAATTDFCTEENSYLLPWVPIVGEYNTVRAVVTNDGVVNTLERAYQDWKAGKLESKVWAGTQMAEAYSWDRAALAMASKIGQVVSRPVGWQYCTVRRVS